MGTRDWKAELVGHVEELLDDERLRIDTTAGRRVVSKLTREVAKDDSGIEVVFFEKVFGLIKKPMGVLRVHALKKGQLTLGELTKQIAAVPNKRAGVPMTLVVTSGDGFTIESHEIAERRAERTVLLAEPNAAGGWNMIGPSEIKPLIDLLDPETEESKRSRVLAAIDEFKADLAGPGVASDKIMGRTRLSAQTAEAEMKAYAKATPGIALRRLEGKVVLFDEKFAPAIKHGD